MRLTSLHGLYVLNVASTQRNQSNTGSSAASSSRASTTIGIPMMCSTACIGSDALRAHERRLQRLDESLARVARTRHHLDVRVELRGEHLLDEVRDRAAHD